MKKRIVSLCLALLLLSGTGTAYAASAGSSGDPLVSLSYLTGTYTPSVIASVKSMIAAALAAQQSGGSAASSGMGAKSVSAGGYADLVTGQTVVLLSGRAEIAVSRGSVVNATLGAEAGNGLLNKYQRYIVCEDSAVTVTADEDSTFAFSAGVTATQGDGKFSPFTDVRRGSWYFSDVVGAYDRGLVSGMTATTYEPAANLTVAQAIKLSACMHQLWYDGKVTLKNGVYPYHWYDSYVLYAVQNGFIDAAYAALIPTEYDAPATRAEFVHLFYSALPESQYAKKNAVPDGAIPDVKMSADFAAEIYAFYRAGILTGYEDGSFAPASPITRAEVATIMNRMLDSTARKSFTIN